MLGHIAAVGLEIEGPWTARVPVEGFVGDFHDEWFDQRPDGDVMLKECVSVPLKGPAQITSFFEQVKPHWYEEGILGGMGFHVHFSFKDQRHYDLALSPKFVQALSEKLFTDFKDDERLMARPEYRSARGTNFYKTEYPEEYWIRSPQRIRGEGRQQDGRRNRYYIVNFWRAMEAHQTFEIRIFPANTVQKMREYVDWVINFVNQYIDEHMCEYNIKLERNVVINKESRIRKVGTCTKDFDEDYEIVPEQPQTQTKLGEQ